MKILLAPALVVALIVIGTVAGTTRTRQDAESKATIRRLEHELEHERGARPATGEPSPRESAVPATSPPVAGLLERLAAAYGADLDPLALELATTKDADQLDAGIRLLLARSDLAANEAALRVIGERRLTLHLPWMLDRLRSQGNRLLRERIAETLGPLGDGSCLAVLRETWASSDLSIKRAAASSLRDLGDPVYVDAFLTHASGHLALPSAGMRRQAACELGRLGGPAAIPLLERALSDTDRDVRLEAVRSLGALRLAAGRAPLEGLSNDPDAILRAAAAAALALLPRG